MDDDVREFGMKLGRSAIARDWESVHEMLAPWLRPTLSVDGVQKFFEDEYQVTLNANGVEGEHSPGGPEPQIDGNGFMNATELRKPISFAGGKVRPLAPEVTDANVRYWMSLQLPCSEEQQGDLDFDFFCEVWIAVVQTPEGLRVGYWSQGGY